MRWITFLTCVLLLCGNLGAEPVTVSAAISLKEPLTTIAESYEKGGGEKVSLNLGATGHLLAQIREGAPVDLFIAASDEQMDQAAAQKLIDPATRRAIAGNRLVLIVPRDAKGAVHAFADLAKPDVKRIAIGQPKTVPAGEYATQVLQHLKLDSAVRDRLVHGASVRQVLDYVARGEVDAGLVYATDVRAAAERVRVVATADTSWHRPIRYVAAVVGATTRRERAARFLDHLASEAGQAALRAMGFAGADGATGATGATTVPASTGPAAARAR